MLRFLRPWNRSRGGPVPARLYTRSGCHLCEDLLGVLEASGLRARLALESVDVDGDRALKKRYGLRLPVLEVDGQEVFEGRPEVGPLTDAVRGALARAGEGTR